MSSKVVGARNSGSGGFKHGSGGILVADVDLGVTQLQTARTKASGDGGGYGTLLVLTGLADVGRHYALLAVDTPFLGPLSDSGRSS